MAIGAAAPWMLWAWRVSRVRLEPEICDWNVLGILDLIVAVTVGAVVPLLFPNVNSVIPRAR